MFRHVGIVVDDLDAQREFYEELIGLEVYYDEIEEGAFLQHITGIQNPKAHILKLGKNGNTIVELLSFRISGSNTRRELDTKGITHFALEVDDLESLHVKMAKGGVKFVNPPELNPGGTHKVAFCVDPEDNFIELVECISEE